MAIEWRPDAIAGGYVRANYSYNDQRYTRYDERLTTGTVSAVFNRDGNRIPGVIPSFANLRTGLDLPAGILSGLGGFAELTRRSSYYIDNANSLRVPGYALINLNLHYDPPAATGWWSRLSFYAAVENLTDKTYVGSASIIANSLTATGALRPATALRSVTGSLYAGQPRTFYAGIRRRF